MPGLSRHSRMPTRDKMRIMWVVVFGSGAIWEFMNLTIWRVNPKREENLYIGLERDYGDKMPDQLMEHTIALRELRDTLTMHQAMASPTPGEVAGALQTDMDMTRLGNLRRQ